MAIVPVLGAVYGDYTVTSENFILNKWKARMFLVKCTCGKIEYKQAKHLKNGRTTSCKSCASKRTAKKFPPPIVKSPSVDKLWLVRYNRIQEGAVKRKLSFELSVTDIQQIWNKQNGRCALTGLLIQAIPVHTGKRLDSKTITASLDRIDNKKGYTADNVWWVHKDINRLKNTYSVKELMLWAHLLVNYTK